MVHAPSEDIDSSELDRWSEGVSPAHRRLAYDEFFYLQAALALRKNSVRLQNAYAVKRNIESAVQTANEMWFSPTQAQRRVIDEISSDMSLDIPMRRLLQGDVGSGKTLVASIAIYTCVEALEYHKAAYLSLILLAISYVVLGAAMFLERRQVRWSS